MFSTVRKLLLPALVLIAVAEIRADDKGYRPDPWITAKTKLALATEEDVSATAINVDTVDAVVTLHGKVETQSEKSRAEEVARRIEGVSKVRNLLQVTSAAKRPSVDAKDDAVKKSVDEVLDRDVELKDSNISVKTVNAGVVLLGGRAVTLSDHACAVSRARRVPGVKRVVSEIESPDTLSDREIWYEPTVSGSPNKTEMAAEKKGMTQSMSDAWITTATKMRLLASDDAPALTVNVDTDNGVVTLFGTVPTDAAKKAAEAETARVSGVRSVVNALEVVPESRQAAVEAKDDDVQAAAEKTLDRTDALKSVDVSVKNGVARLTGSVPTESDRLRAAVIVRANPGVHSVDNDLKVRTQ